MKSRLFILFTLLLAGVSTARAQLGSFGDAPVEITAEGETRFIGGVAVAEDNVVIQYGDTTIYADYAQYDPETRDVLVRNNVRIYREGRIFTGERAVYNLETRELRTADFRGDFSPFVFGADTVSSQGTSAYIARGSVFTTSDSSEPDYYVRSKTVRIYPDDRIVFVGSTLYVGKTPVFWWPYLYQSLQEDTSFTITPGYLGRWGAFLLTQYTFPLAENVSGQLRFDLRSKRGAAIGFESNFKYGPNDRNVGLFRSYYAADSDTTENPTAQTRDQVSTGRYRVSLQHRVYLTDDIYASIDFTKLSDAEFLEDFFQSEFQIDPQPDNILTVTKWDDNYTLNLITRVQVNDFFDTTERLPELVLDVKRQPFFGTSLFYEGETSLAQLQRRFAEGTNFPNYSSTRFDTFHQILYPRTYGGWLSVVPRAGVRGTYYSSSGQISDDITEVTIDSLIPGGASTVSQTLTRSLDDRGSIFRGVFTTGAEASFKLSRVYKEVQSRRFGLEELMHVVQPFTDFSYVYSSEPPDEILQFDRLIPSTQLPPLSFPQFNTIDSISSWALWRIGVRNRFLTKRNDRSFNWLEVESYFDVNLDERDVPGFGDSLSQGTFSNLYNNLRWAPLPWVQLAFGSQIPFIDEGFTEVNSAATFLVNRSVSLNVGHRFISGNPFFEDSSLVTLGGYVRLGDNWGFSAQEQYEIEDGTLEVQRYELHRDLSSWIASAGFLVRDNAGENEFGFLLTLTLKDLPQVSLPFGFAPSSSEGLGSSATR